MAIKSFNDLWNINIGNKFILLFNITIFSSSIFLIVFNLFCYNQIYINIYSYDLYYMYLCVDTGLSDGLKNQIFGLQNVIQNIMLLLLGDCDNTITLHQLILQGFTFLIKALLFKASNHNLINLRAQFIRSTKVSLKQRFSVYDR